jgi:hypothetical protein
MATSVAILVYAKDNKRFSGSEMTNNSEEEPIRVLISHCSVDDVWVSQLRQKLQGFELVVWADSHNMGAGLRRCCRSVMVNPALNLVG